jgi:dihydrodipicolinate synthase/N-acetylneuraminate lyase
MKHVLGRMGVAKMQLRPPMVELSAGEQTELNDRLRKAGVLS